MARQAKATPVSEPSLPDIREMSGYNIPTRILVIGCGGTGAYVVGHLARLISVMNKDPDRTWRKFELVISDGDKVEQKNLERQHFIGRDLDGNKAEVLAMRYSAAFGIEIKALPSYLENAQAIAAAQPEMVIGCVDNDASRRTVNTWFLEEHKYSGCFWIDSGNEENSGQVICGYRTPSNYYYSHTGTLFSLPTVAEIYPAVLDKGAKFNSQLSCAELAVSAPQNMMTNITAASLVLNFAQKVMRGKPISAHGVLFSIDNSFRTLLNTPDNLSKVDGKRRRPWENEPESQTL